jgi:hypothetical protein
MPVTINPTNVVFNDGTTQTTAFTGAAGVTSVATGNGLSGGTITTSGTLTIACPTFATVGSYMIGAAFGPSSLGTNYSSLSAYAIDGCGTSVPVAQPGTWKFMGSTQAGSSLYCRVS